MENTILEFDFYHKLKSGLKKHLKLKANLNIFKGRQLLDIREYYEDKGGEFKPSPKGISLNIEKADALREAIKQNSDVINDFFLSNEQKDWADRITKVDGKVEFSSDFKFFRTKSTGNSDEVVYNSNHPFGKIISDIDVRNQSQNKDINSLLQLISILLLTYNHTLSNYNPDSSMEIGDFTENLSYTWNSLLKRKLK